jgi:hypothetical protein
MSLIRDNLLKPLILVLTHKILVLLASISIDWWTVTE